MVRTELPIFGPNVCDSCAAGWYSSTWVQHKLQGIFPKIMLSSQSYTKDENLYEWLVAESKTDRVLALKSRLRAYLSSVLEFKIAMFVAKRQRWIAVLTQH